MSSSSGSGSGSGSGSSSSSSSSMISPQAVNLSKLIRLDQVEDLLNAIVARQEAQERQIGLLQTLCASLLSKNSANEVFDDIQRSLESLSGRLDRVQASATADLGNEHIISAGELSYLNSVDIQKLKAAVQDCSGRTETTQQLSDLEKSLSAAVTTLREETTPLELGLSLQEAQKNAAQRLASVESLVACKVDRSDVGNLTTLASRLETFSSFKDATEATLAANRIAHTAHEADLVRHEAHLANTDQALSDVVAVLATKTDNRVTLDLRQEAERLAAQLKLCATSNALNETRVDVGIIQQRLANKDALDAEMEQRVNTAFAEIANRATIEQNRACVLRSHYDQAITALGHDLDTKADNEQFQALTSTVAELGATQDKEAQKLSVAMRFVDWFTSRGENYEHNLKLVDKHLRNLAVAANPADRAPFSGQVRYTPFMAGSGVDENSL